MGEERQPRGRQRGIKTVNGWTDKQTIQQTNLRRDRKTTDRRGDRQQNLFIPLLDRQRHGRAGGGGGDT